MLYFKVRVDCRPADWCAAALHAEGKKKPSRGLISFMILGGFMAVHPELLEILVCPKCKGDLYLTDLQDGLICNPCGLKYEIRDDIPIMLIDEAKPIE